MADGEHFSYKPLQGKDTFRLLQLRPVGGEGDGGVAPLQATLLERSLSDPPPFVALSYVWGEVSPPHTILLDDKPLRVTPNLSVALQNIRRRRIPDEIRRVTANLRDAIRSDGRREEVLLIWADAICIDQGNISERNHQIEHMQRIYRQADEVIIDVGEAGDASELVPAFCDRILEANRRWLERHDTLQSEESPKIDPRDYEGLGLPTDGNPFWKVFPAFFARPWFTRVWTIQEAALAQNATIACGDWTMPAEKFTRAFLTAAIRRLPIIEQGGFRNAPGANGARQLLFMTELGAGTPHHTPQGLIELLQFGRNSSASDPRDKVFALLGLASESSRPDLRPDYNEPKASVYLRCARYLVEAGYGARLLYNACSNSSLTPDPELPSWVPDWSLQSPHFLTLAPHYAQADAHTHYYHDSASGNRPASIRISPLHDAALLVSGILVDTVARLGAIHVKDIQQTPLDGAFSLTSSCISEMETLLTDSTAYETESQRLDALWRTTIWNHVTESPTPASVDDILLYHAFRLVTSTEGTREQRSHAFRLAMPFLISAETHCAMMRRGLTQKGYLAQLPHAARQGDVVAVLLGVNMPFVLRAVKGDETAQAEQSYRIIGECYIHGIMNGEAFHIKDAEVSEIALV